MFKFKMDLLELILIQHTLRLYFITKLRADL